MGQECGAGAALRGFETTPAGLRLEFEGEMIARIARESWSEVGPGGARVHTVVVDVPGLSPGALAPAASGPVLAIRVSLFRRGDACGLRVYLELAEDVPFAIERLPGAILLRTAPPPVAEGGPARTKGPRTAEPSGGVQVTGFLSSSRFGGPTENSGTAGISAYQEILNKGWVRGFLTTLFPERPGGTTFFGLGLFGFPVSESMRLDVLGGDVSVPFASPSQEGYFDPGQLLIRGGAVVLRSPSRFRLFAFYGRSASPDAARLVGSTIVVPEISKDDAGGVFGDTVRGPWTLGGGWVLSRPHDTSSRNNFFESAEYVFSESIRLGAVLEESLAGKTGWQTTIAPRLRGRDYFLTGYFRHASDDYTPALGSNLFAGLRNSYQLAGGWQPWTALSLSGGAGQTRSFNILDPVTVGTTSEFEDASADVRLSRMTTAGVFFHSTAGRTDAGALNPADSRTNAYGLQVGTSLGLATVNATVSRETTSDRVDPTFDFRSTRATVDLLTYLPLDLRVMAQGSYADSRRTTGQSAGANYSYSLGIEKRVLRWLVAGIEGGQTILPAGVANFASTTSRIGARVNGSLPSGLQVGASYTWEELRTSGGPSTRGYFAALYLTKGFSWGRAGTAFADAGARSFNLRETVVESPLSGVLVLRAFLDTNGDGRPQSDEKAVTGIEFRVDDATHLTDKNGEIRVWLEPGAHRLTFAVGKLAMKWSPAFSGQRDIEIRARETLVLDSPFLFGGRVEGKVTLAGEPPRGVSPPVAGLLVRLRREGQVLRQSYTGEDGEFFFGSLVPGPYEVELDTEGIGEEYTVSGPTRIEIQIVPDAAARPAFTVRRKTARERFGTTGTR